LSSSSAIHVIGARRTRPNEIDAAVTAKLA